MKKLLSLFIGCSLALAGAALAQPPDDQAPPNKKQPAGKGRGQAAPGPKAAGVRPGGGNAARPQGHAAKPQGPAAKPQQARAPKQQAPAARPQAQAPKQARVKNAPPPAPKSNANAAKPQVPNAKSAAQTMKQQRAAKAPANPAAPNAAGAAGARASVSAEPNAVNAALGAKQQGQQRGKGMKTPAANAKASPGANPAAATSASAAPAVAPAVQPQGQGRAATAMVTAKKPDPQQVQQIRSRYSNFRAQPRPEQVPAVSFQPNYRIQGSDRWQGQQYEAFRSYRPERHDQGWYQSRYNRVELVGGGYYYWDNGYWYPAWGYSPQEEYYAYDAPIYVGRSAEPPDRVIADVQATLQEMGYYRGEVDGLLGPLTREALTAYQASQGLVATAVIDEPTLDSLGMG